MNKKIIFSLLVLLIFCISGYISGQDSTRMIQPIFSDKVFKPTIKTIQFYREGFELSPPLMKFNSNEKLHLAFDDLEADGKEFTFTIIHCDATWQPSDIEKYEYIDGYVEDYIYEYRYSANTIVPYTHYDLIFPTADLQPKIPGNYILKVYFENPDSVYFTRRFMIFDPRISIEGKVKQATLLNDRKYKQEVDFELNSKGYRIGNAYREMTVVIMQNGRWDNAITGIEPKMIVGDKMGFDYDRENVFDGNNEFRTTDFKSLNYYTESIAAIEYDREGYHVVLHPDERRTFQVYKTEDDINGQFFIKTEDQRDTDIQAEYVYVYFSLPYPAPMPEAGIYIQGAFTDWLLWEDYRMDYNFRQKRYEKTLLLKQGHYNYHYVLKYDYEQKGDATFIEGNHSETGNQYTILIYNREPGSFYDRLVGVKHLHANE